MTVQHVDIDDPYIHEPKGVAAASIGQVYVADGAGSGAWASYSAATTSAYGTVKQAAVIAAVTEDTGPVGGTNDGNMPALSTVSGTYVQAEIVAIRDAVRELADKVNAIIAALKAADVMDT